MVKISAWAKILVFPPTDVDPRLCIFLQDAAYTRGSVPTSAEEAAHIMGEQVRRGID